MSVDTTPSHSKVPSATRWPPPQGSWTYDDYVLLPDNGMRYEVLEGDLYMTPAPSSRHQRAVAKLHGRLWEHLQRQPLGEAFLSPIDVILANLASPVQPDLLFIATDRLDIVTETTIEGAPDLVVEVLSPGSSLHDRRTKFRLYAQAGVREYWLIDPHERVIEIYVLRGQAYAPLGTFGPDDSTRSEVLSELSVRVGEICSGSTQK